MQKVVGISFRHSGKVYYFDPGTFEPQPGSSYIVETASGLEIGEITMGISEVEDSEVVQPLKALIRPATAEDIARQKENARKEKEALELAERCVAEHQLDMKLIDVEYSFDAKKIIFFFTADGRIDFRDLVRDLAHHFHARIELRQIGVRDETKLLGGLGICGRPICCRDWMDDFFPVSIRMAKDQNISLNPAKISGLCGRLMCCLKFEHEHYAETQKIAPKLGEMVMTPGGPGQVTQNCFIREQSWVRIAQNDGSVDVKTFPMTEVRKITQEEYNEAMEHLDRYEAVIDKAPTYGNLFDDVGFELTGEAQRARSEENGGHSRGSRHGGPHRGRRGGEDRGERSEKKEQSEHRERRERSEHRERSERQEHSSAPHREHKNAPRKPAAENSEAAPQQSAARHSFPDRRHRHYSAGPRNRKPAPNQQNPQNQQ